MIRSSYAVLFCSLLLSACGSSDTSEPADANTDGGNDDAGLDGAADTQPETSHDTGLPNRCPQIAKLTCELRFRCLPTYSASSYEDENRCAEQVGAACGLTLSSPAVAFSGDEWLACAEQQAQGSCEDYLLYRQYDLPKFPACDLAAGSSADGQACLFDAECASGDCGPGPESTCGTCQPPKQTGDVCGGTTCAKDEMCWKEPGTQDEALCTEAVGIGESCVGKACWDGALCADGACPAPAFGKEGAPCTPTSLSRVAWNPQCYLMEYTCDEATNTCAPLPPPAAPGQACSPPFDCSGGSVCLGSVCVPTVPVGSPCQQDNCDFPGLCHEGTCQLASLQFCD